MRKFIVNLISLLVFAFVAITFFSVSSVKAEVVAPAMSLSLPTISDIDQAQFNAEVANSSWNLAGNIYGDYFITHPNFGSQRGTYTGSSAVVYGTPSIWHISLTFDSSVNNVTIAGKSGFMINGSLDDRFDWHYTSTPGSVTPATSLAFGTAWSSASQGMNINISNIKVNGADIFHDISVGDGSNPFDGILIDNGNTPIVEVDYTMTINNVSMSDVYNDAYSPIFSSMNTSLFIPNGVSQVPEPSSIALLGMGISCIVLNFKRTLKRNPSVSPAENVG